MTRIDEEALERFVDVFGQRSVIQALARIAYAKAEHIRENWQDRGLAETWDRDGQKHDKHALKFT